MLLHESILHALRICVQNCMKAGIQSRKVYFACLSQTVSLLASACNSFGGRFCQQRKHDQQGTAGSPSASLLWHKCSGFDIRLLVSISKVAFCLHDRLGVRQRYWMPLQAGLRLRTNSGLACLKTCLVIHHLPYLCVNLASTLQSICCFCFDCQFTVAQLLSC